MSFFDYDEYADGVATLALYPHTGEESIASLIYPAFGLCGESAELTEKVHLCKDAEGIVQNRDEIEKEFGDVLWYLTRMAAELGSSLSKVAFEGEKNLVRVEDVFAGLRELTIATGAIAEQMKKSMRDDSDSLQESISSDRRDVIFANLVKVFTSLVAIGDVVGITVGEAAKHNLDKLFSRRDRNMLHGSGDNR